MLTTSESMNGYNLNPNVRDSIPSQKQITMEVATTTPKYSNNNNKGYDYKAIAKITQQALDNKDSDTVIKHSSPVINDLQTQIIHLLKMRVIAWRLKGEYGKEIQDAYNIIANAPQDAIGYLYIGYRYTEQGFQKRAIDIFNNGLNHVSKTDEAYTVLCREKNQAQKRLDRRIDFFTTPPYDIVCHIIDFIPQESLFDCARVSSAWRLLVINYPRPWQQIRHSDYLFTEKDGTSYPFKFLPFVSHHIKELVGLPQEKKEATHYLNFIKFNNFPNLCSLLVDDAGYPTENYYNNICSALSNISKTLTTLDISFADLDDDIPYLTDIISTCPNLTYLRIHSLTIYKIMPQPWTLSSPPSTLLTTLILDTPHSTIRGIDLGSILKLSPYLNWLSISNCADDIYGYVQNFCPNVKVLLTGDYEIDWESEKWASSDDKRLHQQEKGLRGLAVGRNGLSGLNVNLIMEEHRSTLRGLSFHRLISINDQITPSSHLSQLTSFHMDYMSRDTCFYLDSLLERMLNLERLSLSNSLGNTISSAAFNVIKYRMPRLSNLSLSSCRVNPIDLNELLESFAAREKVSSSSSLSSSSSPLPSLITELRVSICEGMDYNELLKLSSQIQSLTKLTLGVYNTLSLPDLDVVNTTMKNLAKLPRLQELHLLVMIVTIEHLRALRESISLRKLVLEETRWITEEDQLKSVFESSKIYVDFQPYKAIVYTY